MKNPFRFILNFLCTPTAIQIAKRDLAEGQRKLLKYKEAADYHAQMVVFHTLTNDRLAAFIRVNEQAANPMLSVESKPTAARRTPKLMAATS